MVLGSALALTGVLLALSAPDFVDASSHREAPLIAYDPLADNTDLYAFRSPDNPSTVTIVANYIPMELPEGGPNYYDFGENIRYEIHVKNRTSSGALGSAKDDITYRFTFTKVNEDPTTFFYIRLGKRNQRTRYRLERSMDGGASFTTIVSSGEVPPNNVGPRSIESPVGLNTTYNALVQSAITTASTGERVFAGPRDDPFFVDLGGAFDLGNFRSQFTGGPQNPNAARDGVAGFNTHALVLQIPISTLQRQGRASTTNILDPDFVIGVWASASRARIRTLSTDGTAATETGEFVQVSRLGMPLTNEVIIPIGMKDRWNYTTPYDAREQDFAQFFVNPELGLYTAEGTPGPNCAPGTQYFGAAIPNLAALRVQSRSYPALGDVDRDGRPGLDFRNGCDGAFELLPLVQNGTINLAGTALAVPTAPRQAGLPTALIGNNEPRRIDILPIFYFGVPNLIPYQLATGKTGGPLSQGKPFIHNFLPITQTPNGDLYGGDMLRLNMAVTPTDRNSAEFRNNAYLGLIRAAALGLTAAPFNTTRDQQLIPHMDGFPNGRRLEDDVTTIELQAVGGLVLAAVGLPFDDATAANYSDLASPRLVRELTFVAGPIRNDVALLAAFPYLATPHRGYDYVKQLAATLPGSTGGTSPMGLVVPTAFLLEQNFPNPSANGTTIRYHVSRAADVRVTVYDLAGRLVATLVDEQTEAGTHEVQWNASGLAAGTYFYRIEADGQPYDVKKATIVR